MTRLPALLCGMNAYRKAGPYGRRYLRSMHRQSARNEGGSESDYMSDLCQWKMLMRNFLMCDRCFSAWVPKEITSATGSDRFSIYKRLIPFAWVCQAIRVRLFAAFGLECDRAAEERSVLQSFTHREWNDLIDQGGVSSEELYDIINPDKRFPAELKLYQSFSQRLVQTVSTEKFPNYYRLVHESPHTVLKHSTREAAARVTAENSHFSVRLSLYVMCNDLPDTLLQVLPAFGFWLYCLDEYADLERDASSGKITFMSTVDDPETELETVFRKMASAVEAVALQPRILLDYLVLLQRDVLYLKNKGVDIEKRLLFAE